MKLNKGLEIPFLEKVSSCSTMNLVKTLYKSSTIYTDVTTVESKIEKNYIPSYKNRLLFTTQNLTINQKTYNK